MKFSNETIMGVQPVRYNFPAIIVQSAVFQVRCSLVLPLQRTFVFTIITEQTSLHLYGQDTDNGLRTAGQYACYLTTEYTKREVRSGGA
jgi:hypothetical protein